MTLKECFVGEVDGRKVTFELIAILGPEDGPEISGEELIRRGGVIDAVTDRQMALALFLNQWMFPADWCCEGILILFPAIAATEQDFQKSFVLGLAEGTNGGGDCWSLGMYGVDDAFGCGCHFVRIVSDAESACRDMRPDAHGENS